MPCSVTSSHCLRLPACQYLLSRWDLPPASSSYPVHPTHYQDSVIWNTAFFFPPYLKRKSLKDFYTRTSIAYQIKSSPLSLSFQVLHDLALTHFWNVILQLFPFMDSMFSATPSQLGNLWLKYSSPSLPVKSLLTLQGPGHKLCTTTSSLSWS